MSVSNQANMAYEPFDAAISNIFCPMQLEPQKRGCNFSGHFASRLLSQTSLSVVTSNALNVRRDKSHIGQAVDDFFLLKIQLRGQGLFSQCGKEAILEPGDFTLCSTTEPYQLLLPQSYSQAVMSIPQATMREMIPNVESLLAQRQRGDLAENAIFVSLVRSMLARIDEFSEQTLSKFEGNMLDILLTTLQSTQEQRGKTSVQPEYLFRIKRYISSHLTDPELNPQKIAQALGISKRYLHLMFKGQETTLTRYILEQRLDGCYKSIGCALSRTKSVSEIAFEQGFNDAAHFSRSFKQHFGVSPSKLRD
jgi:AraC-like DNA-binding protein